MQIVFLLYAVVWIVTLVLYSLNWSEFSISLDGSLFVFFLISIFFSIIVYLILKRKKCSPKKIFCPPKNSWFFFFLVLGFWIINFIYGKQIPFFNIIKGKSNYGDFEGIPHLQALMLPFTIFYNFCLFYSFLYKRIKYIFIEWIIITTIFLLIFSRNVLLVIALGNFIILILYNKSVGSFKLNFKKILLFLFAVILGLYVFGGLGNLRHTQSWNDSSYIEHLGLFKKYPKWLPKQFMWSYLYIITPLANLNYNVVNKCMSIDNKKFIVSFIPEIISKRYFPKDIIYSLEHTLLIKTYFNAQTTFVEGYYSAGLFGIYLTFIVFVVVVLLIDYIMNLKKIYNPIIVAVCGVFVSLSFFYNVFYYTETSLLLIYSIIYLIFYRRKKYVNNKRNFTSIQ